MKNLISHFELSDLSRESTQKDVTVNELVNDERRRVIQILIRAGASLKRHIAPEPITVQCLAGTGKFSAGAELEESQDLRPGSFIALDASVEHEVIATSDLSILVSRFKGA